MTVVSLSFWSNFSSAPPPLGRRLLSSSATPLRAKNLEPRRSSPPSPPAATPPDTPTSTASRRFRPSPERFVPTYPRSRPPPLTSLVQPPALRAGSNFACCATAWAGQAGGIWVERRGGDGAVHAHSRHVDGASRFPGPGPAIRGLDRIPARVPLTARPGALVSPPPQASPPPGFKPGSPPRSKPALRTAPRPQDISPKNLSPPTGRTMQKQGARLVALSVAVTGRQRVCAPDLHIGTTTTP